MTSRPAELVCDARWRGRHGIGRFAEAVLARLEPYEPLPLRTSPVSPLDPFRTGRVLRRLRPRVYFSPGFNPPIAARVPFVFTIHDLIHLDLTGGAGRLRRLYYERFVRPAVGRAQAVLTVSSFSRDRIVEWTGVDPARVIVVGNGVDERFSPTGDVHDAGAPYLLFLGNDKPHKNLDRLLVAFARANVDPAIHLLVAGNIDAAVSGRVAALGLVGRVRRVGMVDEAELPALYRGALAVVVPSLHEGFGLVPLEAMACGVPVLAADATAIPEVVGDAALLIDPCDPDAIAAGIERIVTDEPLRSRLAAAGPARATCFRWDAVAERVREALRPLN